MRLGEIGGMKNRHRQQPVRSTFRLDPKRMVDVRELRKVLTLRAYADSLLLQHKRIASDRLRASVKRSAAHSKVLPVTTATQGFNDTGVSSPIVAVVAPDSDPLEGFSRFVTHAEAEGGNCGIGPGGFQPGNTCASASSPSTGPHAKVHEGLSKYPHGVAIHKLAGELKLSQKATKAGLEALVALGHADDLGGGLYGPERTGATPPPSKASSPSTATSQAPTRTSITPASPAAHSQGVAKAYLSLKERSKGSYGLIDIADIVKESGKSIHETLAGIHHLRKQGALSASKYEGRGGLSPHQVAVKDAQVGSDPYDEIGLVSAKDEAALHKHASGK